MLIGIGYDCYKFYVAFIRSYARKEKMYHLTLGDFLFTVFLLLTLWWFWYIWDLHNKLYKIWNKQERWCGPFKHGLIHKTLYKLKIGLLVFGITMCLRYDSSSPLID